MKLRKGFALILGIMSACVFNTSFAQDELTGDTRLACEAILCLSSGTRPSECNPSLNHYYGINKKKFKDTIKARKNFLNLCPVSDQTSEMRTLVNAISEGAGQCSAAELNFRLNRGDEKRRIDNRMPNYCRAYFGHDYTDFVEYQPRYVGTPDEEGYWVEPQDYESELAKYNRWLQEQKKRRWQD